MRINRTTNNCLKILDFIQQCKNFLLNLHRTIQIEVQFVKDLILIMMHKIRSNGK